MKLISRFQKYSDERVNVRPMRITFWLVLLIVYDILFIGFSLLVDKVWDMPYPKGIIYMIIAAYVVAASLLSVFVVWALFNHFIYRHIDSLSHAAQTVAGGDYSVRIPAHRKDGKKDEFQVLFDDFNTMAEALESTEMLKSDFISNISHELKTPLAVIQNFSTMLLSDGVPESDRKEFARNISEATGRLTTLVNDILQLSRLEKQAYPVTKREYNLSEQLSQCIIGFELAWETRRIEIQTDMDESITVNTDEHLAAIIWNNLLSNAFKFTDEGGKVCITVKKTREGAAVIIKDDGCGMTQSQMRHIFERFYQADLSHSTKGNGLGLALVKQITELLGAKIYVESIPGRGSAFTVVLH